MNEQKSAECKELSESITREMDKMFVCRAYYEEPPARLVTLMKELVKKAGHTEETQAFIKLRLNDSTPEDYPLTVGRKLALVVAEAAYTEAGEHKKDGTKNKMLMELQNSAALFWRHALVNDPATSRETKVMEAQKQVRFPYTQQAAHKALDTLFGRTSVHPAAAMTF